MEKKQTEDLMVPFDETLEAKMNLGYQVAPASEIMQLRTANDKDNPISTNGGIVREAVILSPRDVHKIVRVSPLIDSPGLIKSAIESTKRGKEFYPSQRHLELALEDSTNWPERDIEIPVERFSGDELMIWLAQGDAKLAEDYGRFLKEAGVEYLTVNTVGRRYADGQDHPFARQLWLGNVSGGKSKLSSTHRLLTRKRGILHKTTRSLNRSARDYLDNYDAK